MKLGSQVGLGPGHIALDEDPALPLQRGTAPHFRPTSVAAKCMAAWIKITLGMEVVLGPRDFVRWGPRSLSPKKDGAHKFYALVYCGQTAGWIKMVLDMEVGLSPGDFAR